MSGRLKGIIPIIWLVLLLVFYNKPAFTLESSFVLLGEVLGTGDADVKTVSEKWIRTRGKTYPVFAGMHLRTNNGMSSINLRDGVIIEVGKNTDIIISGKKGDCSVMVNKGIIGFMVPDGIKFSVITPAINIEFPQARALFRNADMNAGGSLTGAVAHDGKGTKITPLSETGLALNRAAFITRAAIPVESIRANLDSPSSP